MTAPDWLALGGAVLLAGAALGRPAAAAMTLLEEPSMTADPVDVTPAMVAPDARTPVFHLRDVSLPIQRPTHGAGRHRPGHLAG